MNQALRTPVAAFCIGFAACIAANAQTGGSPLLRSDVKEQTRAAQRSGQLAPAGEGPQFPVPKSSSKTRAQRKSETISAREAGSLEAAGDAADERVDRQIRSQPSTVSRETRKAETRAAQQSRTLTPAGEGVRMP